MKHKDVFITFFILLLTVCTIVLYGCGDDGSSSSDNTPEKKWGTAELIETDDEGDAYSPQVAIDSDGNAIAVWYQNDGTRNNIWTNRFITGPGWSTAILLETDNQGSAYSPQVAIDSAGNAIAVWYQDDGVVDNILANKFTVGTGWGISLKIETDDTDNARDPQIAFDLNDNAIVVWRQNDGIRYNIQSSRFFTGYGWGTTCLIETDNTGDAESSIQIAADTNGNAIAVWPQYDGMAYNINANTYTAGSGWGSAIFLDTDDTEDIYGPQVAMDTSGNAVAVWYRSDGSRPNIWASRYTEGYGWSSAMLVETNDGDATDPQVVFDGNGNAIAVWDQSSNIQSSRYDEDNGWSVPEIISVDDTFGVENPRIAADSNGNVIAVWQHSDGIRYNIWANRYTTGSGWGTAELIETNDTGSSVNPSIAINSNGNAIVVWRQSDGARYNIWANRYE